MMSFWSYNKTPLLGDQRDHCSPTQEKSMAYSLLIKYFITKLPRNVQLSITSNSRQF